MLYVQGTCPFCEAGGFVFRRCADGQTIVLACDECDSVWLHPDRLGTDAAYYPDLHTGELRELNLSVGGGATGWATRAEVERAGWQGYIAHERPDPVVKRRR